MPKRTFFNLPAQKRQRLLLAAREEFSRTAYDQASINRIIHQAGIPRGSFYMYFADKEDLFRHLMEEYTERLRRGLEVALEAEGGDLLRAFAAIYDSVLLGRDRLEREEFLGILRRNAGLCQGELLHQWRPEQMFSGLFPRIDATKLRLEREGDLNRILGLLFRLTGPALFRALAEGNEEAARREYRLELDLLARGLSAAPLPEGENPVRGENPGN